MGEAEILLKLIVVLIGLAILGALLGIALFVGTVIRSWHNWPP